jgi:hypothetical protein
VPVNIKTSAAGAAGGLIIRRSGRVKGNGPGFAGWKLRFSLAPLGSRPAEFG